MLGALVIVFREVIEAGLIIGIVMAATRGVVGRGRWINIGIAAGVLGAAVVAIFAGAISQAFEGSGQELFNASVLGIAVVMLMWHNAWMARHGREIAAEMRQVGTAVSEGAKAVDRARHRGGPGGVARRLRGGVVPLRHHGVGHVGLGFTGGRPARHRRRRRFHRAHLFRPAGDPDALHLLGHELADRAARRRHGGAVGAVSLQCRRHQCARHHGVGYVVAADRRAACSAGCCMP